MYVFATYLLYLLYSVIYEYVSTSTSIVVSVYQLKIIDLQKKGETQQENYVLRTYYLLPTTLLTNLFTTVKWLITVRVEPQSTFDNMQKSKFGFLELQSALFNSRVCSLMKR